MIPHEDGSDRLKHRSRSRPRQSWTCGLRLAALERQRIIDDLAKIEAEIADLERTSGKIPSGSVGSCAEHRRIVDRARRRPAYGSSRPTELSATRI